VSAALTVVVAALVGGCGASQERLDGASAAALMFTRAARAGDGAAICEALAPGTQQELESSERSACADAVVEEELPTADEIRRVDVHGMQAKVVLDGDTLFLTRLSSGWKVTAAGCEPRPGEPYQCRIRGG